MFSVDINIEVEVNITKKGIKKYIKKNPKQVEISFLRNISQLDSWERKKLNGVKEDLVPCVSKSLEFLTFYRIELIQN